MGGLEKRLSRDISERHYRLDETGLSCGQAHNSLDGREEYKKVVRMYIGSMTRCPLFSQGFHDLSGIYLEPYLNVFTQSCQFKPLRLAHIRFDAC